jgi:hypothetical protein
LGFDTGEEGRMKNKKKKTRERREGRGEEIKREGKTEREGGKGGCACPQQHEMTRSEASRGKSDRTD